MVRVLPARSTLVAALTVVLVSAACATPSPHVQLERAPSTDAPFDERARYFKEHALHSREYNHVFLNGGQRVYWPEDLLPAVDAGSTTAKAIQDHVVARERVEAWEWLSHLSTAGVSAGLILLTAAPIGFLLPLALEDGSTGDWLWLPLTGMVAGGALGLGGLGVVFVHNFIVGEDARDAGEAADRAMRTYPQSLSDRLGVGVSADGVIIDFVRPDAAPAPAPSSEGRDI